MPAARHKDPLSKRAAMEHKAAIPLLALLILAGGLRWAVMEWALPIKLIGDEAYYVDVATNLAREGVARSEDTRAWRPPAHPFLLSLVIPSGETREPSSPPGLHRMLLLQVGLGTAVVLLTFLLGRALFDHRTGLVAGALAAVYPNLVAFSHYLWSENLYAVTLLSGLLIVVRSQRRRGLAHAAAAGLAFGIGALTREAALLVGAMAAAWWVATAAKPERSRAALKGALLCAVAVGCVVPWTIRNYRVLGRLVGVSTIGWFAAAEGNVLEEPNWMAVWGPKRASFKAAYLQTPGELARMDLARRYALQQIAAEQPAWVFKKLVRNVTQLFTLDSSLLYKMRFDAYGPLSRATTTPLTALSVVPDIFLFLGGTLGVAAAGNNGRRLLPCLVVGSALVIHVLTAATVRYRIPWIPLFIIYAARVIVVPSASLRSMCWTSWLALAAIWVFFFALCVPYSPEAYAALF